VKKYQYKYCLISKITYLYNVILTNKSRTMTLKTATPEMNSRIIELMDEANYLPFTHNDAKMIGHNLLSNCLASEITDVEIRNEIEIYYNN